MGIAQHGPAHRHAALSDLLAAGTVRSSRRDVLRASAVLTAALATPLRPVKAAPASSAPPGHRAQDIETGVELRIPFNPYGQPVTIDPHRTVNWGPFWVMLPYAWSGLLRFDENGAVEPDLAESVTPNEDGTVWTATLRDGIAFASGKPIVAEHFVASWRRALDPTQLSPMVQFMAPVTGFEDIVAGRGAEAGFRALDDRTIEIALSRPVSCFPSYLATFARAVTDPEAPAAQGEPDPIFAGANAGPWRITELDPASRIVMEPNDHYWAPPSPSVRRLVWQVVSGIDVDATVLSLYREQDAITADVPLSHLQEVRDDPALATELVEISEPSSTLAIALDFNQEPFGDVRVRQAIAAAIDRDAWATEIWQGAYAPSTSFSPPVLRTLANYEPPPGIPFDPDRSRSLLEDAGFDPAAGATITFFQPANDAPETMERHRLLLQAIADVTGIEITQNTNLTAEQIQAAYQDAGGRQFDIVQWWLVTETPALLETVAAPDGDANVGWVNWTPELPPAGDLDPGADAARFQDLIARARAEMDEAARNALYREAEELLLRNAVYIPLGHWIQRFLRKPWLEGTRHGPWCGSIPVRIDADVVVRGRGDASTPET